MRRFYSIVVTAAVALCVSSVAAAGPYDEALSAEQRGDFAQARLLFREAAENGDARAQFNLGRMVAEGEGAPPDYSAAYIWYRKSAESGNAGAQFRLGELCQTGRGVPRSDADAAGWYLKAATQGYASAQVDLAAMVASGRGVPADREQAREWYRKAAEQGDTDGQYRLALMYIEDVQAPTTPVVTQGRFQQLMNDVFGAGRWRETGGYRTTAREDELREQGAETVPIGRLSHHSLGTPDAPGAYDIVVDSLAPDQAAIKLRNSGVVFKRLLPETSHGTQGAHLHVEPYLANFSAKPAPPANLGSIDLLLDRTGSAGFMALATSAQDYQQAIAWLRKAADKGSVEAQFELGSLYAKGGGVPQDLVEASKWLSIAASSAPLANSDQRAVAGKLREEIAAQMSAAEIDAARNFTVYWASTHGDRPTASAQSGSEDRATALPSATRGGNLPRPVS